jgi:hypothetical protein
MYKRTGVSHAQRGGGPVRVRGRRLPGHGGPLQQLLLRGKAAQQDGGTVIQTLEGWFLDYGFPRYITSDSGRQFFSDYDEWCAQNDILPVTSSPHNHESNGLAESAVKQMKALLKKTEGEKAFRRALLHQRNTPRSDGAESPAELFFGRTMRRGLPVLEEGGRAGRLGDGRPAPLADGQRVRLQNPLDQALGLAGHVIGARAHTEVIRRAEGRGRAAAGEEPALSQASRARAAARSTATQPTSIFARHVRHTSPAQQFRAPPQPRLKMPKGKESKPTSWRRWSRKIAPASTLWRSTCQPLESPSL